MVWHPRTEVSVKPDSALVTLHDNVARTEEMLMQLVLRPRAALAHWAAITKQTPNMKIGYPGQHLASLVTGVEGARTGARGHDLRDGSEVKSCSRVDQLDKCKDCGAAVARIEAECPECACTNIKRNNDSKWLIGIKREEDLTFLLDEVPRVVFIISDYPNFDAEDWETLQFQVFEVWPSHERHSHFRTLMENYYRNIYLPHIEKNPRKTPAPKNFWPDSFQFYMCNPVRTFHAVVEDAIGAPKLDVLEYVEPTADRETVEPVPMPVSRLNKAERAAVREALGAEAYRAAEKVGLSAAQRSGLALRDTDHAAPHSRSYRRGAR